MDENCSVSLAETLYGGIKMISEIVLSESHYVLSQESPFPADLHPVIALETRLSKFGTMELEQQQ